MDKKEEQEYAQFLSDIEGEDGDEIRTMIIEQASDNADIMTYLDCERQSIICYNVTKEGNAEISSYTKESQKIFDIYYDEQTDSLYRLLYNQMKILFDE